MATGSTLLEEGTFVGAQRVTGKDGDVSTRLTYKDAAGKTITTTRPDSVADMTSQLRPGDKFALYNTGRGPDGMALQNESRGTFTETDGHGHTETMTYAGHGKVHATHREHANDVEMENGQHVRLHGPGADAAVKGTRRNDEIVLYHDTKGQAVVYNETQRTVSRQDDNGHYTTQKQPDSTVHGELTSITRDPKHPNLATVNTVDEWGFTNSVTINDRPGRIEKLMKPGDAIEITTKDTAPGRSDLSVKDTTRNISYERDHNGRESMMNHPRSMQQPVQGVTHQHGNGPVLQTSPGVPFGGSIQSINNDHGVVKIAYNDAVGNPHTIAIDGNTPQNGHGSAASLAPAALQTLHPGDNFSLKFDGKGAFELTDYNLKDHTKTVSTPGHGNEYNHTQTALPKPGDDRTVAAPTR